MHGGGTKRGTQHSPPRDALPLQAMDGSARVRGGEGWEEAQHHTVIIDHRVPPRGHRIYIRITESTCRQVSFKLLVDLVGSARTGSTVPLPTGDSFFLHRPGISPLSRRGAPPCVPLTTLLFHCPTELARLTFSPWVRLRGVLVVLPEDQARERQVVLQQDDGTSGACVASRLHCSAGTPTGSDCLFPPLTARGFISQEVLAYAVMD